MRPARLPLIAVLALACARDPAPADSAAAAPQQVTITASDYAFQPPSTPIMAGLTSMTLVNTGTEVHHVQLIRITDGKTLADLTAALQAQGPPPAWAVPAGGPNAAPPGGQSSAMLVLEPGPYALICFVPSPDGVPHMAKGMVIGVEVQPSSGPPAALPPGDIQLGLVDYGFSLSQPPTAGTHTFAVTNQAQQDHEVVLLRLAPGETIETALAWMAAGEKGPPLAHPVGGLTAIAPGQVQNFTADFTPGTYGLICFVPDVGDGKPHLVHGMTMTFTVS